MLAYDFFILTLLVWIFPLLVIGVRPDLRPTVLRILPYTLPFALSEPWFYPEYWEPAFLLPQSARWGIGLEDFGFVAALGAGTVVIYPFLLNRTLCWPHGIRFPWPRLLGLAAAVLCGLLLSRAAGWSILWTAVGIMTLAGAVIMVIRADLVWPGVVSSVAYGLYYTGVCWVFGLLYPGHFGRIWHTESLSNLFLGPIPLEEVAYAWSAGWVGGVFIPWLFGLKFSPRGGTPCVS